MNLGTLAVILLLTARNGYAAEDKLADKGPPPEKPRIEVVFCLDTTGSMSGLIAGAKDKIWSIASTMAMSKPAPDIRIGLVGYRDRGDEYVTKITPLSHDLDQVYADLMAYKADGGGDSPESVNQALHEAVHKCQWSEEKKVYRAIFLVGDCPPHMDYKDDVKYQETCRQANEKRIMINTIQCGNQADTVPVWQEIARLAEGQYFQVAQSGGNLAITTPFDAEIVKLNSQLEAGRVYYGTAEVQREQLRRVDLSRKLAEDATEAAAARRAVFNLSESGERNFIGANELIDDTTRGVVKLAHIPADQLPPEIRKMTAAERTQFVEKRAAERKQLQEQLKLLATSRESHIRKQLKEMETDVTEEALSTKFHKAFRAKAADYGLAAPAEAAH
jgi:uncharacterized protein YegL